MSIEIVSTFEILKIPNREEKKSWKYGCKRNNVIE